jgi:hypothetical protein
MPATFLRVAGIWMKRVEPRNHRMKNHKKKQEQPPTPKLPANYLDLVEKAQERAANAVDAELASQAALGAQVGQDATAATETENEPQEAESC